MKSGLGAGYSPHPRTLFYLLTFQLGEYCKQTYHGFAERGRGIEALLHGDEIHLVWSEYLLDEIQRVPLRAGEPVQLVDQHHIKLLCLAHQLLDAGAVQIAACVTPIHIYVCYEPILRLAVRNQALPLLAYGVALLCLFQRGNADIEGCPSHSGIPSNR